MKKITFDILIILLLALVLTALNKLAMLGDIAGFLFIPLLSMYFIGQFAMRKFPK
jgi:uncharacterized SAM-binding protein YcdF (DUF218 family)